MSEEIPTIGRVVRYVSKNGDGVVSPAIVLRTRAATNSDIIERWGPSPDGTLSGKGRPEALVPELESDTHVDLLVWGLGGDYRVYNIPFFDVQRTEWWGEQPHAVEDRRERAAGTWHWPVGAPERI